MSESRWQVEHFGLAAKDPTALHAWYVRVLDGKLLWSDESVPVYFVRLPGGFVFEIYPSGRSTDEVKDNGVAGHRHLALRVESIEEVKPQLAERGVDFIEDSKPAGGGGTVQFFADAEGNLIHLVERPADSAFSTVS